MKLRNLTVKAKMTGLVLLACTSVLVVGALGLFGLHSALADSESIYHGNLLPSIELSEIHNLIDQNRMTLYRAQLKLSADLDSMEAHNARIDELWKHYLPTISRPQEQKLAEAFQQSFKPWSAALLDKRDAIKAGDNARANEISRTRSGPLDKPVADGIDALVRIQGVEAKDAFDASVDRAARIRWLIIFVFACALIGLAAIGFFIVRSLITALNRAVNVAGGIAAGQLNHGIEVHSTDELGQLLDALRVMDGQLTGIVSEVRTGAENVQVAARQMSQGNDDLSQRTQEQASSLEETASAMEEMTSTVKQTAENAQHANHLARSAREHAERGGGVADKAKTAMSDIHAASEKIEEIVGLVEEIAFQTNLLALNAAVEAARAGEHGRGFAVVASEVRVLAQRSAVAAKEIKILIGDSVEKVRTGSSLVDESGQALVDILESVKKVTDIVAEIAAASQEQSTGIDQVTHAVSQMDEVTQQNAALVEEAAAASRAMSEQAEVLTRKVGVFRIHGQERLAATVAPRSAASIPMSRHASIQAPPPRVPVAAGEHEWSEF